jgi:tRNA-uridine 2-sulfurtransferase
LTERPKVVVAMSGGVDSSVAAALLQQQGFDVTGMMLRLWSEPDSAESNRCCTPDSMALARRVSFRLGIPFFAVDAQDYFHRTVVKYFLDGYQKGDTPNPCLVCNRHVRWEFLLERALALGADWMATGHYARTRRTENGVELLRAVDKAKDQSYVLHVLRQSQLKHALFPLGDYSKDQVRQLARDFNLPVADRSESQDLCFLGAGDYRGFIQRHSPQVQNPGPILNRQGELLGQHQGLAFYTIGQRKGLGISSPVPLYVLDKDMGANALIVGIQEELGKRELLAADVNWISGSAPAAAFRAEVKIRYRAREAWAAVAPHEDSSAQVHFDEPVRDITPGQAAVFYDGDTCLGGGLIKTSR